MTHFDLVIVFKLIGMSVLYLFLPLTALTYYIFRRHRRRIEIDRIFAILKIDPARRKLYDDANAGRYFLWAVIYASVVSFIGLALLFLGPQLGFDEFPSVLIGTVQFPRPGSRLVFGMAFLGAYVWGLRYVMLRYNLNDLVPVVYYSLSTRMIFAALTAMVIYNVYEALAGGDDSKGGITATIWPALAFLLGMFPQRGLRWLTDRLPMMTPETDPSVRSVPLEMIEGIESDDVLRLEEVGIDTCYDLAAADFVPLLLNTPYDARELADWILQAKLCIYFGEAMKELRRHSIRTVIDLAQLTDKDIDVLAPETALTKFALQQAQKAVRDDPEIERLRKIEQLLGRFSGRKLDVSQ